MSEHYIKFHPWLYNCANFAHIELENKAGQTPLSFASAGRHFNIVKYLVEVHHCDPRCELTHYMYTTKQILFSVNRFSTFPSMPPENFGP